GGEKPVCYTFSGEKRDTLDARLAGRVAEVCGLEHEILRLTADFFSDFASHVDRTVYVTDGSLGSLGAHEIYLNNQGRALSPERLRGSLLPAWSLVEGNSQVLSRIPTDMGVVGKANGLGMAPRRILSKAVCKLDYLYAEGLPHWLSSFDRLFDLVDSGARLFG